MSVESSFHRVGIQHHWIDPNWAGLALPGARTLRNPSQFTLFCDRLRVWSQILLFKPSAFAAASKLPQKSTESSSEKPLKCPSDTREEEEEEAPDPSLGGLWMAELRMSGIHPLPLLNLMNSPSPPAEI